MSNLFCDFGVARLMLYAQYKMFGSQTFDVEEKL